MVAGESLTMEVPFVPDTFSSSERGGAIRIRNLFPSLRERYRALTQKLRGHYRYYGVIGNRSSLQRFPYEVVHLWRKWLSRRKRRGQLPWPRYLGLLRVFVLPWPRAGVSPCAASP
jgi:hypothetical protein